MIKPKALRVNRVLIQEKLQIADNLHFNAPLQGRKCISDHASVTEVTMKDKRYFFRRIVRVDDLLRSKEILK